MVVSLASRRLSDSEEALGQFLVDRPKEYLDKNYLSSMITYLKGFLAIISPLDMWQEDEMGLFLLQFWLWPKVEIS